MYPASLRKIKIALTVQRYGLEVVGGSELHARQVAEKLAATGRYDVHVYSTCAIDYTSWRNHYQRGVEILNGVSVHRFPTLLPRYWRIFGWYSTFLRFVERLSTKIGVLRGCNLALQRLWYFLQGPVCPQVIEALKADLPSFQRVFVFTYIYDLAYQALKVAGKKAALIPTAHDEPAFYFQKTHDLFQMAPVVLPSTKEERNLIRNTYPFVSNLRIAGLGFDEWVQPHQAISEQIPYVLYLGRISRGKGVHRLIEFFLCYMKNNRRPLNLLLAGNTDQSFVIPEVATVKYLGYVTEEKRLSLLQNALCVINPSPYESLSMIVIEAMALGRPVLVNGQCPVLSSYTKVSESILAFENKEQFVASLNSILDRDWSKPAQMVILDKARTWALENYSWKRVLGLYDEVIGAHR